MALNTAKTDKAEIVMIDDKDEIPSNNDIEKTAQVRIIDSIPVLGLSEDDAAFYNSITQDQRKRIIRKVDLRLVPMLAILYLVSQLDRANIGNAKIEGLSEDLHLVGNQYNVVLALFFIPYILLEVPSNVLLKKFKRPSYYLGSLVTIWGVIMTMHGVVRNFGGLLAVRLLLGVFEAGFYPGAIYLCTFWYMPKELATRIAYFYCTSALSGAFSGLLAAAIAQMDGIGGYEGWRWIFLLEGYSVVMGFNGDLGGSHTGPGYFALVLTCMGIYPVQPSGTSWAANNLAPTNRRAIGVAFCICMGNIGGIIGSFMYLDKEAPFYHTGFGLSLAFGGSGVLAALFLELSYIWANKQRSKIPEEQIKAQFSEDELLRLGDKSLLFRYTL
ncbi:hypothetical protein ACHAPV_007925 [Trichoderma viride]